MTLVLASQSASRRAMLEAGAWGSAAGAGGDDGRAGVSMLRVAASRESPSRRSTIIPRLAVGFRTRSEASEASADMGSAGGEVLAVAFRGCSSEDKLDCPTLLSLDFAASVEDSPSEAKSPESFAAAALSGFRGTPVTAMSCTITDSFGTITEMVSPICLSFIV